MPVNSISWAAAQSNPTPNAGLKPQQVARYRRKLVGADLGRERRAALALRAEAGTKHPALRAVAQDRLQLVADEVATRKKLKPLSNWQASLKDLTPAQLRAKLQQVGGNRWLAVGRELDRRAFDAAAASATKEAARLKAVKAAYAASLQGRSVASLKAEKASLQAQLRTLNAKPKSAARDRALRTVYAKRAVVEAKLPVPFDRKKMHAYADSLKPLSVQALKAEQAKVSAALDAWSRGAVRGTRRQVREAEVKRAIIDTALVKKTAKVAPVDPTRNPGNVVFEGPGMFVAYPNAYPASANAAKLKAAGVTWISLQVHNPGPVNEAEAQTFINQWRAAGFKVGVWGVSYGNAATDGATAARMAQRYGADFYIADCEGAFQAGEGDPARNRQFVEAFQAEATRLGIGNIPRALSSMGRVALDHRPWIDNGWDAMPQAYWNDHAVYEPTACAKFYQDWGWPKDRVHLTIGTYTPTGDGTSKTVADYVEPLKRTGLKGFSFYLPESYLDDAQYRMLKDGIANGMNG